MKLKYWLIPLVGLLAIYLINLELSSNYRINRIKNANFSLDSSVCYKAHIIVEYLDMLHIPNDTIFTDCNDTVGELDEELDNLKVPYLHNLNVKQIKTHYGNSDYCTEQLERNLGI